MTATTPTSAAPAATASAPSVTPTFLRLKLSLLRNGLRQSTGRTVAFVTSIVLALLLAAFQLLGLIVLRGNAHADAVVVPLTALVALGWAVMPLLFPGGDETLDPSRLVMLPLRPERLVTALLGASLIGIGPVFTLTLVLGAALAVTHGGPATVAAVLAVPLTLLTCVALARAVAAANVRLLTSRKGRDLALLSGIVLAIGAQFLNLGVQKLSQPGGLSALEPAAAVLGWLPPASAVAAVQSASDGAYAAAAVQLTLTAAGLAALLRWWRRSLTHLMTSPDSSTLQAAATDSADRTGGRSAGLAAWLPEGRPGAVMLRTLLYAWRDPKAKVAWASSLGIGILLPIVFLVQGNGNVYNACFAAGLLGLQMYNQFGQDYSAFWLVAATTASAHDARVELRARMSAIALVGVPYVALVCIGSAALLDDWAALAEVLGLALALLGALLATGVWSSTYFPYSIPQDSAKNVAPGQGSLAYLSILGGMLVGAVLCMPLLALTIWLHLAALHGFLWLLLPLGVAYGLALCALSLRLTAPRAAARLPEILGAVSR
ncbi:transporter [Streptomyces sp. RKND-216]|uniref:transporter n=1 Tax=Streptomyces sp. RKND-216 TaxID=2562581 RepID=UPI00109DDA50|nr:transporter [Streptomyces sp. RKND-216]THA25873.1 transporter [Streptomyces sp. RKND-216]